MIIKKLKGIVNEFRNRNDKILLQTELLRVQTNNLILRNEELEWAHIYHDTIRGKAWLKDIPISPGRWAVNYSFLYILVRILSDWKPNKIIEFGLGESSKIISTFLTNVLIDSTHKIIEQDLEWIKVFEAKFNLGERSEIIHLPVTKKEVKGFISNSYNNIENKIKESFDLYIVDGPFGAERFSRYDICVLAERLDPTSEFIIIFDDYERQGEKDTVYDLISYFHSKHIHIYTGIYTGKKTQIIITTAKYRFITSM